MKPDKKRRYIWVVVTALYVLFIFSNSMQPADISSIESGSVLVLVQRFLAAVGAGQVGITEHIIRKLAHFTEYTVYGVLLSQCFRRFAAKADRQVLQKILLGFLVPFLDETIQLFVEGRSGQISDVWLDCAGVLFGTILFACIAALAGRIREGKREKKL